jgi:hypothetical protein
MLAATRRDGLSEAFWAMVGGAVAISPSVGEALWKSYVDALPHVPLSALNVFEIAAFVGMVAVAVTIWIVSHSRSKQASDLVSEIRARQPRE